MAITQHIDLNIIPNSAPVIVHVDQYDHGTGRIIASLYEDSTPYTPASASVYVQGTKPDGKFFVSSDGVTLEGNVVTADLTEVMTQVAGQVRVQFVVTEQTGRTGTFVFWLDVQASALPDNSQMSESDISMVEEAIETMQEYVSDSAESAQEAATSAAAASQSKEAAEAAATSATGLAEDSEAFARGTRNGVPVEPGDEAYHDNAKYWAEYAESVTDVHPMTASTLGIGRPDGYTAEVNTPGVFSAIGTTIVATVNPGGTAYTSDWLVDADDNVITPDSRRQYRVTVEGKTSLWWWTGTEYKQLAGGGHVVTKTDGTPMPQRANLELAGAKLTDESASDTTKVEFYYEYPTLAAAEADLANIPEGARVIIKEADYVGQIDNALSLTSNNPVQNKVVTAAIPHPIATATGNGTKTVGTLLNELWNTIKNDLGDIKSGALISRVFPSGETNLRQEFYVNTVTTSAITGYMTMMDYNSNVKIYEVKIAASSTFRRATLSSGATWDDFTANTEINGTKWSILSPQ